MRLPGTDQGRRASEDMREPIKQFNWEHYAGGLLMMALVTIFGLRYRDNLDLINVAFLYQLPVVLSASWWGRWPSYFTALCSVLAYDIFFVPPVFLFTVHDIRYVLSFIIFLIVAFIVGGKTEYLRMEARRSQIREKSTRALYQFARGIAGIVELDVIVRDLCTQVAETLEREVVVLAPGKGGGLEAGPYYNPFAQATTVKADINSAEMAAATWAYTHAGAAGRSTETLPDSDYLFVPLISKGHAEGVLGVRIGTNNLPPEQRRLIETWVGLAALAIERIKLEETAHEAALLVESERLHTALFNSLSHELRTPLSSIIGAVSTLIESENVYSPEQKTQLLDEIRGGARRLERVVANLLDTARLESGKLELKFEACDIEDIIGAALRQIQDILKGTRIEIEIPQNVPFVLGDCVLIELVLVNLLDNAVKFSPPGSPVTISAHEANGSLKLSIIDKGIGIPEDDLPRIFDKFYQVKNPDITVGGSGLGLSICKAIVEAHGGAIWAKKGQQSGATISFTIPKADKDIVKKHSPEVGEENA